MGVAKTIRAGKSDPRYFGYAGARNRFLKFFPNGFHSDGYANQERNYKLAAKKKLDDAVPLEDARYCQVVGGRLCFIGGGWVTPPFLRCSRTIG